MNYISWKNKRIINEGARHIPSNLIEESIAATLKPVMNKMKKLNIGVPYRDARIFFFQFLRDTHPDIIPAGFETRKPSAKDVNAIVGQIAMEQPELLSTISDEFNAYSSEQVGGGLDRVSQFLNTAATLRQGKGVRQSKAEAAKTGGIKKDYSKLTAQEIANATTDAIAKKKEEFDAGDDVSDEKLLLRTAVGSVISQLENEDVPQEALDNVSDAVSRISTLAEFEKFLDYIADFEEYSVIYQYLVDTMDVIETNLEDMQAEKEDEEYEQEESLVGKEALLDLTQPVTVVSHDEPGFVYVMDQDGGEMNVSIDRLDFTNNEDEEEPNIDNTPLEELSILTPEDYEAVQNFDNFNPDEWGFNKHENIYFRKREGGEVYESYSTAHYMGTPKQPHQVLQESNRLSPQEVNRQLILNEKKRVQHLYTQQRRYMDGY